MKHVLLVFVLIMATTFCKAQANAKELIGTWTVTKVELSAGTGAAEAKEMASIKDAFLKSRFHFKAGNHFAFDFAFPDMRIKDGFWTVNSEGAIEVREWKDRRGLLMKVFVQRDGLIKFLIDETPFVLEVKTASAAY